jgi:iron complex outermembrane recepter protein
VNLDQFHTDGVDFQLVYRTLLSRMNESWGGSLTFRLLANYVDTLSATAQGTTINEAGAVGSNLLPTNIGAVGGIPHWRGNLSATYTAGPATVMLQERYVGSAKIDNTFGPTVMPNNHVPAVFYTDASIQYVVAGKEGARDIELYGNINNLFNQFPPIVVLQFIAPTATNGYLYDVVGRTFLAGVRFKY